MPRDSWGEEPGSAAYRFAGVQSRESRLSDGGLTGDDYSEVLGHSVSSSGTEVKADAASKLGQATFRVEGSEQ